MGSTTLFQVWKYPQRRVIYCSETILLSAGNILAVLLFLDTVYILKDELKQIPILRGYFNRLGLFSLKNKAFKSLKTVLRSARRLTKNQKEEVFVIFPEGELSGETGKINPGFLQFIVLKISEFFGKIEFGDHWINKNFQKSDIFRNVKIFP